MSISNIPLPYSQIRQGISVDSRGTAYVVFWNVMDAKNALDKLNGFNFQNRYLVGKSLVHRLNLGGLLAALNTRARR